MAPSDDDGGSASPSQVYSETHPEISDAHRDNVAMVKSCGDMPVMSALDDLQQRDAPQSAPLLSSSTVSRGNYHQCGAGRRVKLYMLEGEAWDDKGTGYCAGVYDEGSDDALIVVRKEDKCESLGAVSDELPDDADVDELEGKRDAAVPYMVVVSETLDTDDILLQSKVVKEDVYQRQQDTLVVWTEPSGLDLALSFQELDGCNEVWDFLTEVQRHFMLNDDLLSDLFSSPSTPHRGDASGNDALYSDDASDSMYVDPFRLPSPDFSNLEYIENELQEACSHSAAMRGKVVEWLLREDYVAKLIPRFEEAEELESLPVLHQLYRIMKAVCECARLDALTRSDD